MRMMRTHIQSETNNGNYTATFFIFEPTYIVAFVRPIGNPGDYLLFDSLAKAFDWATYYALGGFSGEFNSA